MNASPICLALIAAALAAFSGAQAATPAAAPPYVLEKTISLGAPDRWDYVVVDPSGGRVYVAHGDRVAVIDPQAGNVTGEVTGMPGGTHGVAISHRTGKGYTDDGKGQVVGFDLKSLKTGARMAVAEDADAMAFDPVTGHVFVMHGDPSKLSVVDPKTDKVLAVVDAGEKLEYAVADGAGSVFIAGNQKRDVLKLDTRTNKLVARWPTPDCASPHGLAVDPVGHRAFMSCVNSLIVVVNTRNGAVVAKLPIGRGSDAAAFDPQRKRVFSSNGVDGDITVYQQVSPDRYERLGDVTTAITGRTMDVDPKTGRLFVAAAEVDAPATPGGAPRRKPGSLRLMVFKPAS